jgi:hypothetical protein
MKNTIKLIALTVFTLAVSTASAQKINGRSLSPNANKTSDGQKQGQNVQVNPNKVVAPTSTNVNVEQPNKNAGSISKPQTLNANGGTNTSVVNPNQNSANQPQTIDGNSKNGLLIKPAGVQKLNSPTNTTQK